MSREFTCNLDIRLKEGAMLAPLSKDDRPKEGTSKRNRAALSWLRKHREPNLFVSHEPTSREIVRHILSTLGTSQQEPAPFSKDIKAMGHLVAEISDAAEQNVITEDEADAVVDFLVKRFVERRVDDAIRDVFTPGHGRWFLASASLKTIGQR